MGTSKTARASMVQTVGEKKVIPDADYIKNLRYDVNNSIHATQEGAKALLREYDKEVAAVAHLAASTSGLLKRAEDAEELLRAANARIADLQAEISAAQAIFSQATIAEAKNNHD